MNNDLIKAEKFFKIKKYNLSLKYLFRAKKAGCYDIELLINIFLKLSKYYYIFIFIYIYKKKNKNQEKSNFLKYYIYSFYYLQNYYIVTLLLMHDSHKKYILQNALQNIFLLSLCQCKKFNQANVVIKEYNCKSSHVAYFYFCSDQFELAYNEYSKISTFGDFKNKTSATSLLAYAESAFICKQEVMIDVFYRFEYFSHNSEELSIILCPDKKLMFENYKFSTDRIYIFQNNLSAYFIVYPDLLARHIINNLHSLYKKIYVIGSSKSATGALLVGTFIKSIVKSQVKIIAFSPIIDFLSKDSKVNYSSYVNLIELASQYHFLRYCLTYYGNVKQIIKQNYTFFSKNRKSPLPIIVYGEKNEIDASEANKCVSCCI